MESNNKPGPATQPVGANKLKAPLLRRKRWLVGAAGALATYTVGGFWLLPQVVQSQLPKFAHSELERNASIGAVRFNPFTLCLEADDFRLDEANGAPLFAVGKLAVELNWSSIVRRAWSVAEVRVGAPRLHLAIAPDGTFNIAQLLDTLNRRPKDPSSGMPRLIVGHFALERGKVEVSDRRAGYADTITPIDFALNNLSTLPDRNGDYTLSADATHGGKLHWRGTAALNPIGGGGELTLDQLALPGLASYLKAYTRVGVSSGKLSAKLPYRFAYADGKLDASLSGASLSLRELALVGDKAGAPFASVNAFDISDVGADLAAHSVTIGGVRLAGAKLEARRNAKGELDLAQLMIAAPAASSMPASAVAAAPAGKPAAGAAGNWKVQLKQLAVEQLAMGLVDETVSPPLTVSAENIQLKLALHAEQAAAGLKMSVADAAFSLAELSMVSGKQAPLKLAQLGFTGGTVDLAGRQLSVDRVYADGGQLDLTRDSKGKFMFMGLLPKSGPAPATPAAAGAASKASAESAAAPWSSKIGSVELSKFGALYDDQGSGIKVNLQDFNLKLDGVSNDLKQALPFKLAVGLREGGHMTGQGKIVPATGALESDLLLKGLALAPVQPLLAKHVKLKIAGGVINGQGHLSSGGAGTAKNPTLRYAGMFEVATLRLNEQDNDLFAAWKSVRADKLTLNIGPDSLDIPELRVVEPNAKLIIEDDRSLNAQRLLVRSPEEAATAAASASAAATGKAAAPAPTVATAPTPLSASAQTAKAPAAKVRNANAQAAIAPDADAGFPVRVRRLRLQNAKLDFTDLSLRPQFSAKIYELNGIVNGLSTRRDARSQIELDGRVDEFGLARVRGQLNPFVPADNTDLDVVFKNVDMVSASPYSMKFAGYKIAEGKISLDLQYKVRAGALEGNNHIVLDKMTLGERIDSPDALKLPLELALAILKDSDGRIDLGLPVAGNLNDPQFSYGALVWKAVGNVLGKVVTAPFRALGALLGINGDKLEAVDFDAGSARLLPPEREKLKQVAQILAKRAQLSVTVPGQYSEAVDGAALREQALRRKATAKAGIKLEAGEAAGPLNLGERAMRGALRDLYAERFGAAELDKQKKAAEAAAVAVPAGEQGGAAKAPAKLPVWQRVGKLIQGEPQVADPAAFYGKLRERLEASEVLPADALAKLGAQRAAAIVAALAEAGVDAASARAGAPEPVGAEAGKQVALKLGLSAK
ncbi:DUF748 domain-containing protein [Rugamonas rubra]|uniref:DUF748 domain-containing protein n=1 Tax=Rugamonas rubra TaxID=758825 RepID=UPI001FECEF1F|nr:DUF748 domain-containing protein [Rugamonas rubra]